MNEQTHERSIQVYGVALWCSWPVLFPDHVGHIQASGSYAAVVCVMEQVGMEKVAYAAARQVGHPRIDRWSRLYIPLVVERRGRR
jgi:ABC-type spermidine/putrescine transport system permease subunit II